MPASQAIPGPDSRYAWTRLGFALTLSTLGACGMYLVVVVLPLVQAEFGVDRSGASLPYTLTMLGFGFGGILMGRLADRYGIVLPLLLGATCLGIGFILASMTRSIWPFALVQGLLIGLLGSSASFGPLVADTSLWFDRRRGIAVAICASGNYLGGALWPPIAQHYVELYGWRDTYFGVGVFCLVTMIPVALCLRRPKAWRAGAQPAAAVAGTGAGPGAAAATASASAAATATSSAPAVAAGVAAVRPPANDPSRPLGLSPAALQWLLVIAGLACCVAMSMPQVHIVAYCGDLGYGAARGAQMLSLMLGFGIVSRLASGFVADRIGGLRTLLVGSCLQTLALVLFLPFDSLASLYVISALFGLFQGGIVPSYALIVREYFSPREAGERVGTVLMATLFGMALGGWMSGKAFDLTGSYAAAFLNGIGWNLLNVAIVVMLLRRRRPSLSPAAAG